MHTFTKNLLQYWKHSATIVKNNANLTYTTISSLNE